MLKNLLLAATATGLLAACATPTPYQPANETRYGYSDQRLETDRFRVSFSGNSLTDRETVENYLLLRAAELSLQNGEDYFRVVTRATDEDERIRATSNPFGRHSFLFADYRYYHPYYGWYGRYDPFFNDVDVREITRYEATAEIKLGAGPDPDADNVFNAREVHRNLIGHAVRPE